MPAFRNIDGPGSEISMQEFFASCPDFPRDMVQPLSDIGRETIIRFMLRDDRVVFGGRAIAAAPR
jgi:hypothetical protein